MGESNSDRGDYRIEISGWGLDNGFFTERTELLWTNNGEKQVQLRRVLAEGAIVFVRLLSSEPSHGSVPVAYQAEDVVPMDRNGRCVVKLTQMHARSKRSPAAKSASNLQEEGQSQCDATETTMELEPLEIFR